MQYELILFYVSVLEDPKGFVFVKEHSFHESPQSSSDLFVPID